MMRRLVLVGGGRAHLRLLHAFAKPVVRGAEIVLVTDDRHGYNPAMTAGLLRGAYDLDDARVDLARMAERAGARVVAEPVSALDLEQRVVVAGAERVPFDLCSLDVVGWPEGADLPGVVQHALPLRPVSALPSVRDSIMARLTELDRRIDCVVVGGGKTGVETAFAMQRLVRASAAGGVVTIVDGEVAILAHDSRCRDSGQRELERAGVCFALGARVVEVTRDGVVLASGATLPADIVLWATPGAPPSMIRASGLPLDARGRLLVDRAQRSRDGAPVWAAGDCAASETSEADTETHEGVQLERSLRAALDGSRALSVQRRRSMPCLLDTGDDRAIIDWGVLHARARWGWWLRQRRDRRFVSGLVNR